LIQATRRDAARGLLDIERLGGMLKRIKRHIIHKPLDRISPLAVPVLLDIGKVPVFGEARESAMADAADELMQEALGHSVAPKTANRLPAKATLRGKNDGAKQRGSRRAGR
jgi:ATP-dependent Lhr-like helicase